jgi:zinc protease
MLAAIPLQRFASAAERFFPYAYQQKTLPNGLTVVAVPMPTPGLLSYFTVVRTGSRDEVEPGKSGFAHFFEHMMFRGAKGFSGLERDRIVNRIGARENASTRDDFTMYYLTFAREDLPTVVEIESDRFQRLCYDRPGFQTEAAAVHGEYRIYAADPWFVLQQKLQDLAYDTHTYKHLTIGLEPDIEAMPAAFAHSLAFYRHYYRPDNVVLLLVGDVDWPNDLPLIEKHYDRWEKGYKPPAIASEPPQTAPRSAEIVFPGRTMPILAIAHKGEAFDPNNRDYVAARLLGDLAFGPQSRLHRQLVLREQKVDALRCDFPMRRDPPLFQVSAMVRKPEDVESVRDEILRAFERFKTEPVAAQELADAKRHDRYAFLMELDSPFRVAGQLAQFISLTGGIEAVDRLYAAADQVTPQDIMHAARKYFAPERRTTIVLRGSEKGEGKNKRTLPAALGDTPEPPRAATPAAQPAAGKPRPFVLQPVPGDPTVSFRLWFKVGSQNDPPGKEGLAALTAAMLAEGATLKNTREQILAKLLPSAASYVASTNVEMTIVSARVHKDNLGAFYPLLIEAICQPAFRQNDFDRIRNRTVNYLENTLRYSSNEELAKAVLYSTLFAGTPYGHLPEGTIAALRTISLDDVRAFHHKHYTRENLVVGVGGGYDDRLLEDLRRDTDRLSSGQPPAVPPPKPSPVRGRQVTIVEKACDATAISIGFPIDVCRGSKEWYALAVAASWLGQHRHCSCHLSQVLREARGLNYGDYCYLEHFPNGATLATPPVNVCRRRQIFEIWVRPVPHAARHFALRAVLRELQRLIDGGMSEADFNATRDFLRKYAIQLAPTSTERLGYAIDDRFYGIDGSHLQNCRHMMDQVTLVDVNAAIRKYWQCENLQVVFVTQDARSLKDAIIHDAPSPIDYPTPKPASVLDEDGQIGRLPLRIRGDAVQIVPVADLFLE